jgi:hypothetical protein
MLTFLAEVTEKRLRVKVVVSPVVYVDVILQTKE